jgi:hypothetical protein
VSGNTQMKKRVTLIGLIFTAYVISYLIFRNTNIEIWEKDAGEWINFNKNNVWIYYFYQPLIYIDSNLTSLGIYIEP